MLMTWPGSVERAAFEFDAAASADRPSRCCGSVNALALLLRCSLHTWRSAVSWAALSGVYRVARRPHDRAVPFRCGRPRACAVQRLMLWPRIRTCRERDRERARAHPSLLDDGRQAGDDLATSRGCRWSRCVNYEIVRVNTEYSKHGVLHVFEARTTHKNRLQHSLPRRQ